MKKTLILTAVLLAGAPLAALASCESVKADISQKIINNGVPSPASNWRSCLTIRPIKRAAKWSATAKTTPRRSSIPA